jgi:peroxiredoxin
MSNNLSVNDPAPDFTLKDGNGDDWRLSDQRGKVVVLLFYPGDETPVCTRQMCSVRDRWDDYLATGSEVVGISGDSVESHSITICLCGCFRIRSVRLLNSMALSRSFPEEWRARFL